MLASLHGHPWRPVLFLVCCHNTVTVVPKSRKVAEVWKCSCTCIFQQLRICYQIDDWDPWYLMCDILLNFMTVQGLWIINWFNHLSRCNHSVHCLLQCLSSSVQHLCRMLLLNSACWWANSIFHYFCLTTDWLMNNADIILLAVFLHLFSRMWRQTCG